jgi:hypothetical protein
MREPCGNSPNLYTDLADAWCELLEVPVPALEPREGAPRQDPGRERDAQVDGHRLGDIGDGDVDGRGREAQHGVREGGDEQDGVGGVEGDAQERVESHERGAVLGVAPGKIIPNQHLGCREEEKKCDQASGSPRSHP